MADFDLEEKFPDMRPVKSVPSLWTVNGCGLSIYGRRDFDEETHTYVKTHCLCFLFVPFVFLGAYRVADAPRGWYFIGRVPLSGLARTWNCFLVVALLSLIGFVAWDKYTHSPEYLAWQQLEEADRLVSEGKLGQAAPMYRDVALGGTSHARTALTKFKELLDGPVNNAPLKEAAAVFRIGAELEERGSTIPGLSDRAMKLADKHGKNNPRGALEVVDAVAGVAKNPEALTKKRQLLLERIVKQELSDPEPATQLALIYEAQDKRAQCEKLLTPHRKRLGIGEGARILGQIYARQGKLEQAHALLLPYAEGRLAKLHQAEETYRKARTRAADALWARMKTQVPPDFPLERYKGAGKDEKMLIQMQYEESKLKNDPAVKKARQDWDKERKIGPVALDLGIVILRRAQGVADPAARRKELEKAEKVFLAIRNVQGDSNLRLAQVYYWLDKPTEGRKLFKQVLDANNRAPTLLITVSELVREVGVFSEARQLAEEAYNNEKDPAKKHMAAIQRALIPIDTDDKITWLRRSDTAQPQVKAMLQNTLGTKAYTGGKDDEAERYFRDAVAIYERLPQETSTLNNSALAYYSLYRATGDTEALDKAAIMLEKAANRRSSGSIVLFNAAGAVEETALRDIIGSAIDLKTLRKGGNMGLLAYLYQDRAGMERYVQRVRKHKGVAKALTYYNRLLILSRKKPEIYSALAAVYGYTKDLEALRRLWSQLEKVDLDLADSTRETLASYQGKKDDKLRKDLQASVPRQEALVKATRQDPGGVTFAVAAVELVGLQISGEVLGRKFNPDKVVALAEEAYAAAPSTKTHSTLRDALLFRASRALVRQEPAYAAMASRARRSLHPAYLIAIALGRQENLREAILGNKDVQRTITLLVESRKRFPNDHSPWTWAMLRTAKPDEAAKIADGVLHGERGRLQRSISQKLAPVDASTALVAYWTMQIAGKEAKGLEILKRCAAQGVPMPFDLK